MTCFDGKLGLTSTDIAGAKTQFSKEWSLKTIVLADGKAWSCRIEVFLNEYSPNVIDDKYKQGELTERIACVNELFPIDNSPLTTVPSKNADLIRHFLHDWKLLSPIVNEWRYGSSSW